jgi:copper(I)-binding protein
MRVCLGVMTLLISTWVQAAVTVSEPWVKPTAPGQKVAGAYLQIVSTEDARLIGGSASVAETVELHEMSMQGDIMKMRRLDAIELPAGKQVELKPGGYHIMLFGIVRQIKEGDVVPIKLIITNKAGDQEQLQLKAVAKSTTHEHK